jgi:hypothetical protein
MATFVPQHPMPAHTIIEQLCIDACRRHVWQLVIAPTDPIVQDLLMFNILLPNAPRTVHARLGALAMQDANFLVFDLHTGSLGAPPFVVVTRNHGELCHGLTQLVLDWELMFTHLG